MTEFGTVTAVSGPLATIRLEGKRPGGCGACRACTMGREGVPIVEGFNAAGAQPGQRVEIEVPEGTLLQVSVRLYGIPLTGFLAGAFVTAAIPVPALRPVAFFGCFIPAWIGGIRLADRYARLHRPRVIRTVAAPEGFLTTPTNRERQWI